MANVIKIKNSGTANSAPTSLEAGELAINYADGDIYYKNASNAIVKLNTADVSVINDISDVIITAPAEEFQTLQYDGSAWTNKYAPVVSYVRNAEANTITTGTCVYLFGSTGDHATVKRADNNSDTTSSKTIGVVGANIASSQNGPIITRGYIDGIDLSVGYTAGDVLWLGENGAFTKTKPTAPDHLVFIGVVVRATNNGIIYVATQNGYELDELHDVSIVDKTSGDFLKYNGTLWVNDQINLGTDTVGNYMSNVTAGNLISITHTPGEGSSAAIAVTSGTSGQIIVANSAGVPTWVSESGDVTISDTGVTAITSNVIVNADINSAAAIAYSKLSLSNSVLNADINSAAAIAHSKLANATAGQVLLGTTTTGVVTATTISGDITINGAGVATIAANSVALGTDTTGNYMSNVSAGTGISVSHTPGEGSTATVSLSATLDNLSDVTVPSPTTGQFLKWDGTAWVNATISAGGATISLTPPSTPTAGDLWYESDSGKTFVYYDSYWIEISASDGAPGATGATGPEGGTTTLTTKGDILARNSTEIVRLPVGTNGQVLTANSNAAIGMTWVSPTVYATTGDVTTVSNSVTSLSNTVNLKANIASPTFTGAPLAPTAANTTSNTQIATTEYVRNALNDLINSAPATLDTLGEIATSLANNASLSSTLTSSIAAKAPLASPTFTGTVTIPAGASISGFATLADPTFTGTVSGITKTMVGLGSVDNTTDLAKPISNATQTALDLKAPLANATFTGTVVLPATTSIANVSSTEIGYLDGVTSAIQTQINAKSNTASPTFTGTVTLPSDTSIGNASATEIGYLDGVTSAIQTQLNAKAPLASPTFTGSVVLPATSAGGTISPSATNTYDLGTASLRWRNIYTQDLHLNNGIGDYTVIEGEENLYLVNHKTNKSFKFALIEVDSSEVPKASEI